jgi:hypothetical protein
VKSLNRKQNIIQNLRIAIGTTLAVAGVIMFITLGKTTQFKVSGWLFALAVALFVGGILLANSVKVSAAIANFFMR